MILRSLLHLLQYIHQEINIFFRTCLSNTEEHRVLHPGITSIQPIPTKNADLRKMLLQSVGRDGSVDDKFIKEEATESGFKAWNSGDLAIGIVSLLKAEFAHLTEALFT